MTAPTPDQVTSVQQSLSNLDDLMRDTHNFSLDVVGTLFQLEEQQEVPDENVWVTAGELMFLGVVGCIPYVGAAVAGLAAATYVVAQGNTKPQSVDFNGSLAEVSDWMNDTFVGAISQIDTISQNVAQEWTTPFTAPGYPTVTPRRHRSSPDTSSWHDAVRHTLDRGDGFG